MDEYQFQHQGVADLEKAASDAVNRTLWLQHWRRRRKLIRRQWFIVGITALVFAFPFIPWPTDFLFNIFRTNWFYISIFLGLLVLASLMTGKGAISSWFKEENQSETKRPKTISTILNILYYPAMIFNFVTDFKGWHPLAYLPAVLFIFAWDWREHCKLKRNLIEWGVLEPDGSPRVYESAPITVELKKSEERIDEVLGSPNSESSANRIQEQRTLV